MPLATARVVTYDPEQASRLLQSVFSSPLPPDPLGRPAPRLIEQRRARSTGVIIMLLDNRQTGYAGHEGGFLTYCVTHRSIVRHNSRRLADALKTSPEVWCRACAASLEEVNARVK